MIPAAHHRRRPSIRKADSFISHSLSGQQRYKARQNTWSSSLQLTKQTKAIINFKSHPFATSLYNLRSLPLPHTFHFQFISCSSLKNKCLPPLTITSVKHLLYHQPFIHSLPPQICLAVTIIIDTPPVAIKRHVCLFNPPTRGIKRDYNLMMMMITIIQRNTIYLCGAV